MNTMKPLLIELGAEELPVKALPGLAQAFHDGVLAGLIKRGIAVEHANAKPLYSPRRLAVLLEQVADEQPEQRSEVLGPYLNIGLDANGEPTPALRGFAQKNGVDPAQLVRVSDAKGERFAARSVKPGAKTAALLQEVVLEAITAMPIPKPMRWGDHDYGFARPVHWLVMLHGKDVVAAEVFGVRADRMSRGHRFHHPGSVWIGEPGDYVDALRGAHVLVDPDERRECVRSEVAAAAAQADGTARASDSLVDEVNCLVEWPRAILCGFDPEFLRVPHEALISTMESNQKFFPVLNDEHRMTGHFVGVANLESADPSEIRKGYERVIRPRFADARFFYDEDVKQGLDAMRAGLASVTYQQKLGSYADKTARVAALAEAIAKEVGVDPAHARRAAELSKADLQSRMVNEFPELQGIAGRYYASAEGETGDIADAIDHAYMPRFAGDEIAPSKLGQVLAIAERLDTLAGGFAAGLKPTGNKDPFALRRNALGLARTIIEGQLDLDLNVVLSRSQDVINFIHAGHQIEKQDAVLKALNDLWYSDEPLQREAFKSLAQSSQLPELQDFVFDRLRGYYADQGYVSAQFDAVTELKPASLLDFDRRLKAIGEFAALSEAPALAAANKRIRNILKKSADAIPSMIEASLFDNDAERALHAAVDSAIADTDPLLADRDYVGVLRRLAMLRPQVDAFFDGVMVNVEDVRVRGNRLALLKRLADRFGSVAEIALLATG
ncbi:MAG TPA: glycine--tRNA ligase subunit beta [Xanthomonadaceae bacterium]|jgi:glycyl-tRNA synthetase beta chain